MWLAFSHPESQANQIRTYVHTPTGFGGSLGKRCSNRLDTVGLRGVLDSNASLVL